MPLTNAQYNSILRIFDEKQLRARRDLDARREQAYAAVPRLREIDSEVASIALAEARSRIRGGKAGRENFTSRLADLSEERRALLAMNGFAPDHLEERCECALCRDTGFVNGRKCGCFLREEMRLVFSDSNLSQRAASETFAAFSLDFYPDDDSIQDGRSSRDFAADGLRKAKEFAQNFDEQFRNLFIFGGTGVGKTFLSNCIANEALRRRHSVLYLSSFDLFDTLIGSSFEKKEDRAKELVFSADLLIIDDLGAELTNALVSEKLFQCLNARLTSQKATVISSNLSLPELGSRYSERVFSRIIGNYGVIPLFGKDIRREK